MLISNTMYNVKHSCRLKDIRYAIDSMNSFLQRVSSSVSQCFKGLCEPEETSGNYGRFLWPETEIYTSAVLGCPLGPINPSSKGMATRQCQVNGLVVKWLDPDYSQCKQVNEKKNAIQYFYL